MATNGLGLLMIDALLRGCQAEGASIAEPVPVRPCPAECDREAIRRLHGAELGRLAGRWPRGERAEASPASSTDEEGPDAVGGSVSTSPTTSTSPSSDCASLAAADGPRASGQGRVGERGRALPMPVPRLVEPAYMTPLVRVKATRGRPRTQPVVNIVV